MESGNDYDDDIKNLYDAISNNLINEVEYLINKYRYKSLDIVNSNVYTTIANDNVSPLLLAIYNRNYEIAILLINNGADINYNRKESILYTVINYAYGSVWDALNQTTVINERIILNLLQLLIDKGADVNFQNEEQQGQYQSLKGISPLMFACKHLNLGIIELLLNAGADPNLVDEYSGHTALTYIFEYIFNDSTGSDDKEIYKAIELLLQHNANPNLTLEYEQGPLYEFVREIQGMDKLFEDIIILLLEYGADPYLNDYYDESIFTNQNIDPEIQSFIIDYMKLKKNKKSLQLVKGINEGPLQDLDYDTLKEVIKYIDYNPISEKREIKERKKEEKNKERKKKRTQKKKKKQKKEKKKKKLIR